jgi:HEAT repeat protein
LSRTAQPVSNALNPEKTFRRCRRSIGRSNEVVAEVLARPGHFRHVFAGLSSDDLIVRMRAADAVEKITAQRPEFLQPFKKKLLAVAGSTDQQEVRWHAALMIPRLKLTPKERAAAVDILFDYLRDRSSIVKTWAMQGLSDLAGNDSSLRAKILPLLEELTEIGTPAMRARGRKILQHLNRQRAKA